MGLAPMLAPIIGGWILLYLSWHWIFLMEAFMGIIACLAFSVFRKHCQKYLKLLYLRS